MRVSPAESNPLTVIFTKNFSLLLALRYLNPLRTHVSVITLISLAGVALGVMVLVVVMSVMAGFENMVKDRVLGESPHITVMRTQSWDMPNAQGEVQSAEVQWRALENDLESLPSVESAYPLVRDYVIVDIAGSVVPVVMRGIDTEDAEAMQALKNLEEAGDVGIGIGYVSDQNAEEAASEVAVVSSIFAEENGLSVGDVLEVISNRNIKQLKPLLERKGSPSIYQQFQESFNLVRERLPTQWIEKNGKEQILYKDVLDFRAFLEQVKLANLRQGELEIVERMEELTKSDDFDDQNNYYPVGRLAEILAVVDELQAVDTKAMDEKEELLLNELALPKEVRIAGIYRADRFAPGPPLLVPLHLAQELAGVGSSGGVNGVALRLKDPYLAAGVLENELLAKVPAGWAPVTWMEQYKEQFSLISMQKIMMTLALSFIVLIAVFSIGAVMFTVTIQKKREIGVMKALGATPQQVTMVFAFQGVIVGLLGSLAGVGLSLLVLGNLQYIQGSLRSVGFDPFSKSFYGTDVLPHVVNYTEISLICVLAFLLCSLAAYAPAWVASRADAARSLRNL